MNSLPLEIPQTPERELIVGVFYDKDGNRHEYAYTAVGVAPADVIERANARERACHRQP